MRFLIIRSHSWQQLSRLTFGWREGVDSAGDGLPVVFYGVGGGLCQEGLQHREGELDRIEVRAVGRGNRNSALAATMAQADIEATEAVPASPTRALVRVPVAMRGRLAVERGVYAT